MLEGVTVSQLRGTLLILGGLFIARDQMSPVLEAISNVLPLSYAIDAMNRVTAQPEVTAALARDIGIVAGCGMLALILGAATLRRRTP